MEIWNRYGPTAARVHGKPGRAVRPSSLTIDVHSHVAVPEAAQFVKPHLDFGSMPLVKFATTDTRALNQRQDTDRTSRMTKYDERIADLDEMGIDLQVVKPPPPQCYYTLPAEIANKASRMVNDGLVDYVSRRPDRFIAFGTVPLQDGSAAAAELERCVTKLGFKGVQILTNVAGRELSDPAFTPFWAKAEQLGVLVVIHPNGFTEATPVSTTQWTL
jgi:aminocarboxymuconate-semialdehyde decarboxylase